MTSRKTTHMEKASLRHGARILKGVLGLSLVSGSIAVDADGVSCGDVLGPGGNVFLSADLLNCPGNPALTIIGPVSVDLQASTISCASPPPSSDEIRVGIVVEGQDATVLNGTVTGCGNGVNVAGTGYHRISYLTTETNAEDGIRVTSNDNRLLGNTSAENGDDGFEITGDGNGFIENTAERNEDKGFDVGGGDHVLLANAARGNGDEGFDFGGDGNRVVGNVAADNDEGIDIDGDENELVRNVATGHADEGILVDGDRNRLTDNVSSLNAGDGFEVDGDGNRLVDNRAEDNGSNGIDVQEGELNNSIVGNVALGNPDNDLEDDNPDCDGNLWLNNTFETRSDDCID